MTYKVEHLADGVTLYLADCRDVFPTLSGFDAVVTDPPYGVGFTGKKTKHSDNSGGDTYDDTEEHFRGVVLPAISTAINMADRAAIFTGTRRLTEYPPPRDIGGIVCPNGTGFSAWGFSCYHPVAFYGTSPYLAAKLGSRPTATAMYPVIGDAEKNIEHPCPKPIAFMEWAVNVATLPGHRILDPFMGSGTTGVAAVKLGRQFVGVEIDQKYFDIACKRIADALKQPDLFVNKPAPATAKQDALL